LPVATRLSDNVRLCVLWGTGGAILLRVALIAFVVALLTSPFLKIAGGLLLLWIGVRLMAPAHDPHAT